MKELPNFNEKDILINIFMKRLREHVTIYIESSNLKSNFYNLSDFYLINKIIDKELKLILFDEIIKELLERELYIAHVFNKTGIIITKEKEDFDSNVWRSNLDFTPLV
tara:strand:- start:442 stop:765 length:324 start_codon:yes stop_codon:yes gene_type:complete